jgi:hypothetical protein
MTTFASIAANAAAFPIPEVPPVMRTVLPPIPPFGLFKMSPALESLYRPESILLLRPRSVSGATRSKLGIRFEFLRGNMTDGGMRDQFAASAPFDVILFVGLSAWLPKPGVLDHLLWIRKKLREDGILVTDSFTAETYALSGRYIGYRANYYEPEVYRTLVDHCGFDGLGAEVESGRDGINHVLVATLR